MNIPIIGRFIDERFLMHRLRSTSTAGIATAILAVALFEYRYFVDHVWNWDLFAIAVTFAAGKMGLMIWYRFKD